MVRRRIHIKKIEDKSKRHTTFTKRRQGLFKKANDLWFKCGSEIAIITFSLAGNAFAFGHPSVDSVVDRYLAETSTKVNERVHGHDDHEDDDDDDAVRNEHGEEYDENNNNNNNNNNVVSVEKKQELELHELDQLKASVEEMKRKVKSRVNEIMMLDKTSS